MCNSSYFSTLLGDGAIWTHLQQLLQKYEPELAEKYLSIANALSVANEDARALVQAYRAAIASDALFAFGKGMEANLHHFLQPSAPYFTNLDFCDLYQEHVMLAMPKRKEAEQVIATMEAKSLQGNPTLGETFREFFVDLEVVIPKIMHFEGYLAGNDWFRLSIPGYIDNQVLTGIYQTQISIYFGL